MPSVLVLLPRSLDATDWRMAYARGEAPDATPYGYHHAQSETWLVRYSTPAPAGSKLADRIVSRLCGFDLLHAFRNRRGIFGADVIWTHTEREHLALSLLLLVRGGARPVVIAQSVWLMDNWDRLPAIRKWLYKWLLAVPDVLTFHSPLNAERARQLLPDARVELVPFGISLDSYARRRPAVRAFGRPLRVLSLGNDQHRDWPTLAAALGSRTDVEVMVGSRTFSPALLHDNIRAAELTMPAARALFDWADMLVVPLVPNLHASGLTTVLEAVALGVPVVATRTGGLDWYFGDDCITYVEPRNPDALNAAVLALTPELAARRAQSAFERLTDMEFSTVGYARRHLALSEALLMTQQAVAGEPQPV